VQQAAAKLRWQVTTIQGTKLDDQRGPRRSSERKRRLAVFQHQPARELFAEDAVEVGLGFAVEVGFQVGIGADEFADEAGGLGVDVEGDVAGLLGQADQGFRGVGDLG